MPDAVHHLLLNLACASGMVVTTVTIHFFGLMLLTYLTSVSRHRLRPHEGVLRQAGLLMLVILGIFALVTIHVWLYAALYRALGEMPDFETALYYSTTTFTAVGFGDVVVSPRWRIVSAIEAARRT